MMTPWAWVYWKRSTIHRWMEMAQAYGPLPPQAALSRPKIIDKWAETTSDGQPNGQEYRLHRFNITEMKITYNDYILFINICVYLQKYIDVIYIHTVLRTYFFRWRNRSCKRRDIVSLKSRILRLMTRCQPYGAARYYFSACSPTSFRSAKMETWRTPRTLGRKKMKDVGTWFLKLGDILLIFLLPVVWESVFGRATESPSFEVYTIRRHCCADRLARVCCRNAGGIWCQTTHSGGRTVWLSGVPDAFDEGKSWMCFPNPADLALPLRKD